MQCFSERTCARVIIPVPSVSIVLNACAVITLRSSCAASTFATMSASPTSGAYPRSRRLRRRTAFERRTRKVERQWVTCAGRETGGREKSARQADTRRTAQQKECVTRERSVITHSWAPNAEIQLLHVPQNGTAAMARTVSDARQQREMQTSHHACTCAFACVCVCGGQHAGRAGGRRPPLGAS